ncbi:D-alanyl-D-alanine carboxypeptidase/D-alanyl-D-alanine endopeptidase [Paludifilum halophilum]|uniref:D-alanyl-D-alanine carboxypeptidase/D-alanyl-D-alanine-endopeptidase n=1 Tax=Paludifilum halophilum TaxID=1642702 RepID=A0A235BD63_9BACL|nr:D-alanyl-D-alanine carboxypeptidase/D-alanyl-D-alanine-endopeptidase [Paludifilum halophilum]OYD09887.1 hypothetical protein CHM34_02615 [Paludifilum halophilum]
MKVIESVRRMAVFLIILALAAAGIQMPAGASADTDPDELLERTLRHYVEDLKEDPGTKGMAVGYEVASLEDDRVLASYHGQKTFVPDAVSGLWVSAAAMEYLPADLRLSTELYLDGSVTPGGVLEGDVSVKGYGDPALTVRRLKRLARAVADRGIRRVSGDLIVDDSYFDRSRLGISWMWDQEPYPSSAQNGALSVNGNTVTVKVTPGARKEEPRVTVFPAPDYVEVENRARTVAGKSEAMEVTRTRAENKIRVTGTIGADHPGISRQRTIDDPGRFTGVVLKVLLEEEGVCFHPRSRVVSGKVDEQAKRVASSSSPKVDKLLRHMVKREDHLYGEMLLKQLGARIGREGSDDEGIDVLRSFARERVGVDETFRPKDGSGYSRMSVMSPHQLVGLLAEMDESSEKERFFSLFHTAGEEGPLKERMKGTPAVNNLRGVSGSAKGVSSLTGTVKSRSGERLAFSVMVNGAEEQRQAKALEDRIGAALASYPELPDPGSPPEKKKYPLSDKLDPILNDPAFRGILHGMVVRSAETGEALYERNPYARMTPASNTKLFTSSTALNALGPDYRFETDIYLTGPVHGGVLMGDVVIEGHGDPTLATEGSLQVQEGPTIEKIAKDLKQHGIRKIRGDIRVDASDFSDAVYGEGWAWDNESDYYQPQITALSVNRGTVRFDYLPGEKVGDPIRLSLTPKTDYVQVIDEVVTGPAGSKNTVKIRRDRGTNTIRLTGSLPLDFKGDYTRVPVEDPHRYTGTVLKEALEKEGVRWISGEVREGRAPPGKEAFRTYRSEPLSEAVRYLNKVSDNFYAEMILKTVGVEIGDKGTAERGLAEVNRYMRRIGLPGPYRMRDGSGLTRYNQFSPDQLAFLLAEQRDESHFKAFYESLPIAGVDGALRYRMKDSAAEGNLRGKTGSLTHVSSLSGYVRNRDGELLVYSIVMNGYTKESERALQNRIGIALAEFSR